MRKVEKVQTEVEVVKEILCDLCGNKTRILRDDSFGIDQFSFATSHLTADTAVTMTCLGLDWKSAKLASLK